MDWSSENLAHPFSTCLKIEDSLLKHNELDHCHSYGYPSLPSDLRPFLPNIPVSLQASTWDCCPPHPVPLFGHAPSHPTPPPSDWPMLLLSQTFTYTNTPTISSQLFFLFKWHMKMEPTVCSKTLAQKIQMQINHPKERIQHSQHRESLQSRIIHFYGEETEQYIQLFKKLQIKKSKIKKNTLVDSLFHNHENNEGLSYKYSSVSRMTWLKFMHHYYLKLYQFHKLWQFILIMKSWSPM